MATAVVSLICIALVVFGGMTMSQGFLSSADTTALGVEEISVRDGEIMRTELAIVSANSLWTTNLRARLENTGQTKLANFSKWDVIVQYYDDGGSYHVKWLPYTEGTLGDNEWQKTGIYLNRQTEVFEPGILNPGEEIVIGAKLSPSPQEGTGADVIVSTPNGVQESTSFSVNDILTCHSETASIASTGYYQLKPGTPADGAAMTMTTDAFARKESGRKIMYNESDPSRPARHVFSLTGISEIPASTWTVYYRGRADGRWRWGVPRLNIDIIIRKSDGTIRETIATDAAEATIYTYDSWQTVSATYDFPGYTVVDGSDYLEIDYYGSSVGFGPFETSYLKLRVDDSGLAEADQTRVEA